MKLHIGYPVTGCNKSIVIDDENKLRCFYDARVGQEIAADTLGNEFKGYVFKITGGQDKDGFPMKQGVLTNGRVRLLLKRGTVGFQRWRGRAGERRRKSVRGCIVGTDIAVLNLIIVKKGENEIPGLTDETKPRTFGPKRASKIRKLFNLSKKDDVRKYVIRHKVVISKKEDAKRKEIFKAPKIQRLITPERLRRKRQVHKRTLARREKAQKERKQYQKLLKKRKAEWLEERKSQKKKRAKTEKKVEKKPAEKKSEPEKKAETATEKK